MLESLRDKMNQINTSGLYKITAKKAPELVNGRVKRTGKVYYEVSYWAGFHWKYKEFETRVQAREFIASISAKLEQVK